MSLREITCNYCDDPKPRINYGKIDGKSISTNLNGTPHKHIKNQLMQASQQQPAEKRLKIEEGWAKAHEENMQSNKELRESIDSLSATVEALVQTLAVLTNIVAAYTKSK